MAAIGLVSATALALLASAAASAQSLKTRQLMAAETADLGKDVDQANRVCESALTAKFDWSAAPTGEFTKYSPEGYCRATLEGIQRICTDRLGKDAVRKQIKTVVCGFASTRAIDLKDGSLNYSINFSSTNDSDFVFEFLQNQL